MTLRWFAPAILCLGLAASVALGSVQDGDAREGKPAQAARSLADEPAGLVPVLGESVLVVPVRGTVLVRPRGEENFVSLVGPRLLPVSSEVDATAGEVELTSILDAAGNTQSGSFYDGRFRVLQARSGGGLTELELTGGDFSVCLVEDLPRTLPRQPYLLDPGGGTVIRRLWGNAKGKFRTRGLYSSTTVRGTAWLNADRCDGTLTEVDEGEVVVFDLVRKRETVLTEGDSYLAAGPFGGIVNAIAVDPNDPRVLFAGTGSWPHFVGAVFKSSDGGESWQGTGLKNAVISDIAVDPTTSNRIYAAAIPGRSGPAGFIYGKDPVGVFRSDNGGATWTFSNTGIERVRVWELAVDPVQPDTVYAATGIGVEGDHVGFPGPDHWDSPGWAVGRRGRV